MARVKKTWHELKRRGASFEWQVAVRVEKPWHELKSRGTICLHVRVARLAGVLKLLPRRRLKYINKKLSVSRYLKKNSSVCYLSVVLPNIFIEISLIITLS